MSAEKAQVTLTIEVGALRDLFMAGNHSSGGGLTDDINTLSMALDIIEHAAMELYALHDALNGNADRADEHALHAWRLSRQLEASVELVRSLEKAKGAA